MLMCCGNMMKDKTVVDSHRSIGRRRRQDRTGPKAAELGTRLGNGHEVCLSRNWKGVGRDWEQP